MNDLIHAYKDKILCIRNYVSDKKEFHVSDFTDLKVLADFLDEVDTSESDISPAGKSFLEKNYGFEELAKLLIDQKLLTEEIADYSVDQLVLWFEQLEPMQAHLFIEKSRGNMVDGQPYLINEDLLPPGTEDLAKSNQ